MRNESNKYESWIRLTCNTARSLSIWNGYEVKHIQWDPKDGELYLVRLKPEEILVEDRSSADVQIVCQNWAKGRKTHRTI